MQRHTITIESQVNTLFQKNLPKVPYCTNDYEYGIRRRWQRTALKYKNIQFNEPFNLGALAFDLDFDVDPIDLDPMPNLLIQNAHNGRAHALIVLQTPVHAHSFSSLKAQAYYKRVLKAITRAYGADPAYTNFLCKNPFYKDFRVKELHSQPYDLDFLSEWILPANEKNFNLSKLKLEDWLGLGRNCDTFHRGRFWAYFAIREFVNNVYGDFYQAVYEYCYKINYDFNTVPLPINEVRTISKSIAKWVFEKRFDLTNFSKQVYRGEQSGKARHAEMLSRKQTAITLLGQGLKINEIADRMGVQRRTIHTWLQDYEL